MPRRDTSVAIKQTITSALNAKQGHKPWLSIKPLINLLLYLRFVVKSLDVITIPTSLSLSHDLRQI